MQRMRHRTSLRPLLLALASALAALLVPITAVAAPVPAMPPAGKVLLGLGGHATNPAAFDDLTGARHGLYLITVPWNDLRTWDMALGRQLEDAEAGGYRLMVHIGTQRVEDGREAYSPGEVARGDTDAYLLDMSRVINESGQYVYVRPPAEMNGHWSHWSAFNANGSRRDADHSTRSYRSAFIRIALIARGGSVAAINRRLAVRGLPTLSTDATYLPRSGRVATVFNPQARGKPDVRGNQPQDYYPGRPFVDYVANDLYAQGGRAAWDAHEALYRRYAPAHPFMVAEYAPWGYDDPGFVERMFAWVASHPRTVALVYFNGTSGSTFRLEGKPRSLAAYRRLARHARYSCPGLGASSTACAASRVSAAR
jgi:beta-mannanase